MMKLGPHVTPRVFIGHAREDQEKALRLYEYLQIANCYPWTTVKNAWPAERWEDAGREAARVCDFFVACLSRNSASDRGLLDTELRQAYEIVREIPSRQICIIPVRLEDCAVPPELEEYTSVSLVEREGFSRLVELIWREWTRQKSISETQSEVAEYLAPTTLRVVQLLDANTAELKAAISLANAKQSVFNFELHGDPVSISNDELGDYRLTNGGLNLHEFTKRLLERHSFRKLASERLVFVTAMPFSDRNLANKYTGRTVEEDLNQCYILENGSYFAENVTILSTYVWDHLPVRPGMPKALSGRRALKPFLLSQFAKIAVDTCPDIRTHEETLGCPFDYYKHVEDIDLFFDGGRICDPCERILESALWAGQVSVEQLASVRKLLNMAVGRKECAVVTAPGSEFSGVYSLVEQVLRDKKWAVRRPSMTPNPLGVLDRLLTSDLIIADITAEDPYVFYLASIAQANDQDLLLLLQDDIPFNLQPERVIRYQRSNAGYQWLARELSRLVESEIA